MNSTLSHLADATLLRNLDALVTQDRRNTAQVIVHIGEVERRKLFAAAGYPSMFAFCMRELHLSEDETYKRIYVARTARRFPAILAAVAEGRLHLTGALLLRPFLTQSTAADLIAMATHKSKREIQVLLAERFPQADLPARVVPLAGQLVPLAGQLVPEPVVSPVSATPALDSAAPQPSASKATPTPVLPPAAPTQLVPEPVAQPPRTTVTPLSPGRYGVQFTMDQAMLDKLAHAQALLGHQIPSGDFVQVMHLALDALIARLEKRKFAATSKPRARQQTATTDTRRVPAQMRRQVWRRDGGRCTFVGETGRRCEAVERLEFDHVQEFARGGRATASNLRLRCKAHNQYTAECTFGVEFMSEKRRSASRAAAEKRARAADYLGPTAATPPLSSAPPGAP